MTEDDNGSDNSQFTGSTINLQDLEWAPSLATVYSSKHSPGCLTAPGAVLVSSHDAEGLWDAWSTVCGGSGHESTDNAPWQEEMSILFVEKMIMCLFLEPSLYQNPMWAHSNVRETCGVGQYHGATLQCCLRSSCLTDASRCAFLHWPLLCFLW